MKNKGFTLIELLAVIVILAVIVLIAIPVMLNVINKSKLGSLKDSAYGMLESANLYYAQYRPNNTIRFDLEGNKVTSNDTNKLLSYKGSVENGVVILDKRGNTTLCITDGTNSAYKNYTEKEITVVEKNKCYIPDNRTVVYLEGTGATRSELTNQELTDLVASLQEEINELKSQKADQSDLDITNGNLEIISTVASSSTLDKIYPIGSIYMSMTEDTVAKVEAKFGGTWEKLESGRMLQSTDGTSGTKGGSASASYTPSGTVSKPTGSFTGTKATLSHTGGAVGNHTLTVSEMPAHEHPIANSYTGKTDHGGSNQHVLTYNAYSTTYYLATTYAGVVGGSGAHNHPFTQPTAHTYTPAGSVTVSQPTFTGTAATINTVSPYITVYMYKRVG